MKFGKANIIPKATIPLLYTFAIYARKWGIPVKDPNISKLSGGSDTKLRKFKKKITTIQSLAASHLAKDYV